MRVRQPGQCAGRWNLRVRRDGSAIVAEHYRLPVEGRNLRMGVRPNVSAAAAVDTGFLVNFNSSYRALIIDFII